MGPGVEHPPIDIVAGQLMGSVAMHTTGLLTFLQPQPVLQISTGATGRNQGQFAFTISGVNPGEVYETGGKLIGAFYQQAGKLFLPQGGVSSDMFLQTPNLQIEVAARSGGHLRRFSHARRNAPAKLLQPELRLPHQATDEPVSSHSRSRRSISLRSDRFESPIHQESTMATRTIPVNAIAKLASIHRSAGGESHQSVHERDILFQPDPRHPAERGDRLREGRRI